MKRNYTMKKLILITFVFCGLAFNAYSAPYLVTDTIPYEEVEQKPEFPGGIEKMNKFINNNLNYPVIAQKHGIQGKVIVGFTVQKDGSIVDVKALRSPSGVLAKEAVRVVSLMPKWKPGKLNGEPVAVRFTLPIHFQLIGEPELKAEYPEFPGGMEKMYQFISDNFNYSEQVQQDNISDRVMIQFIVQKDGSIKDINVLNSPNELLSEEMIRIVKSMPNWIPGKKEGNPVNAKCEFPIDFTVLKELKNKN